jgi:hypothetical protein
MKKIMTKGVIVTFFNKGKSDFISLTDIARYKNSKEPKKIVQNWMRTYSTIEFLGIWESIHNPHFKGVEFEAFKKEAGSNAFLLSPQKWIEKTNAVGLVSKSGRYGGGTFAHTDIAFEFASWISAEFKLYLIKEFQRLKEEENERLAIGWDVKRTLAKINYKIHTDAVRKHLVPPLLSQKSSTIVYATEADVLNKALFGKTAKEWREHHPKKEGNIRDYADMTQLVVLANLEAINADLIRRGFPQNERLILLNETAIAQMQSLLNHPSVQKLKKL